MSISASRRDSSFWPTSATAVSPVETIRALETRWQQWIPFLGVDYREGKGHLSDAEVARYTRTTDFASYVAQSDLP